MKFSLMVDQAVKSLRRRERVSYRALQREFDLKAIKIAQRQQAKSLELRATMSLVRLRQRQVTQQGSRITHYETRVKLAEAHTMLSEVYNWFTKGFDTRDLQEAKVLLEALAEGSI